MNGNREMDDKYELKDAGKHYYHNDQSEAEEDDDDDDEVKIKTSDTRESVQKELHNLWELDIPEKDNQQHTNKTNNDDSFTNKTHNENEELNINRETEENNNKTNIFTGKILRPYEQRQRNREPNRSTEQRYKTHLSPDNEKEIKEKLKIINIKDERLCNFLWCYFKYLIFIEKKHEVTPEERSIIKNTKNIFTEITSNHKERYKQIISTLEHPEANVLSDEDFKYTLLKKIISDFNRMKTKCSLPKIENEKQILWASEYIMERVSFWHEIRINPISTNETFAEATAITDVFYYTNRDECYSFLKKLNKTLSQKNHRKNTDKLNLKIQKNTEEKLEFLAKTKNKSKSEIIKNLINREYEAVLSHTPLN